MMRSVCTVTTSAIRNRRRRTIADLLALMHATDVEENLLKQKIGRDFQPPTSARGDLADYLARLVCTGRDRHDPFRITFYAYKDFEFQTPEPAYDETQIDAVVRPPQWTSIDVANRLRRALAQATRLAATMNATDPASQTPEGAPLDANAWTHHGDDASATLAAYSGDARRFDWLYDVTARVQSACAAGLSPDDIAALVDAPDAVANVPLATLRGITGVGTLASRECRW